MQRTDSLEKTLLLGKIESTRRRGQQSMRWLDGITDSRRPWRTAEPGMLQATRLQRVGHASATEQQ